MTNARDTDTDHKRSERRRTSFTDQTSGCRISASGGDFLMRRRRHVAAFFRTMGRTAPFVCQRMLA